LFVVTFILHLYFISIMKNILLLLCVLLFSCGEKIKPNDTNFYAKQSGAIPLDTAQEWIYDIVYYDTINTYYLQETHEVIDTANLYGTPAYKLRVTSNMNDYTLTLQNTPIGTYIATQSGTNFLKYPCSVNDTFDCFTWNNLQYGCFITHKATVISVDSTIGIDNMIYDNCIVYERLSDTVCGFIQLHAFEFYKPEKGLIYRITYKHGTKKLVEYTLNE